MYICLSVKMHPSQRFQSWFSRIKFGNGKRYSGFAAGGDGHEGGWIPPTKKTGYTWMSRNGS